MKFTANERLLELLVGGNLYGKPDVAVRELVQNAWDAIQLRIGTDEGFRGTLTVEYSPSKQTFTVSDNGIGMTENILENSFLSVGQDKLEVLGLSKNQVEQVGFFGIGVLSVFLIAEKIIVHTRAAEDPDGLYLEINGLQDNFEPERRNRETIGTSITIKIKDGCGFAADRVPPALREYARHVPNISIVNSDTGETEYLEESWDIQNLWSITDAQEIPSIRAAKLGFVPCLLRNEGNLENSITICNAGFRVEKALDLLPFPSVGISGEVDLHPGHLAILMAREGFLRDDQWANLGTDLRRVFVEKALYELRDGHLKAQSDRDSEEVRRAILIWSHVLRGDNHYEELIRELQSRLLRTVPFSIAQRANSTLENVLENQPNKERLYFRLLDSPQQARLNIDDAGVPVTISEEIRDSVIVSALAANGFSVLQLKRHRITVQTQAQPQTVDVQELDAVRYALQNTSVEIRDIASVLDGDMDLSSVEVFPEIRKLFGLDSKLGFARIEGSARRVVRDPRGYKYMNINSPDVKRLLKTVPEAMSNPLKQKLLDIFLDVELYQYPSARQSLMELLESDDLKNLASVESGLLTQQYLRSKILREIKD